MRSTNHPYFDTDLIDMRRQQNLASLAEDTLVCEKSYVICRTDVIVADISAICEQFSLIVSVWRLQHTNYGGGGGGSITALLVELL